MPNDRLADELVALESIYPDAVTWTERQDGHVDLSIHVKVDFDQPRAVVVDDFEPPPPATATRLPNLLPPPNGHPPPRDREQSQLGPVDGRSNRARPRGNHRKPPSSKLHAPDPSPLLPQPGSSRETPTTRAPAATPPSPRAIHASPVIPLSHSQTPRISFTPRPASPPPSVEERVAVDAVAGVEMPTGPKNLMLRHLPPLHVSLELPPDYPESSGPSKIDLETEGNWLGEQNRRRAIEKLQQAYVGDECLFGIAELVSSASPDFFDTFSLSDPIHLTQRTPDVSARSGTRPPRPRPPRLSDVLVAYDESATAAAFANSSHECPLCFAPRKGSNCVRLDACGCTFCVACLGEYFSMLIAEGMARSVACPAIQCVQDRAKWDKTVGTGLAACDESVEASKPGRVSRDEVERLCGTESRERFEWLKEKIRVESDPSISFCPRETCQAPTPKLDDNDKLRVCSACQFAYCVFCRKGWHGTRNACSLPESNRLVTEYLAADENEKRTLERRYGAANLKRLVAAFEEEKALQEWLKEHSTPCPGCSVPIEKSHGCNHMTCGKCGTHLCYRCGKSISPTEPYRHFNTPSSICYGKLFDFSPGQEPPVEAWLGELLLEEEEQGNAH